MYLRLTRSSARRARSPRALQLAGPQSGGETSSESVALGPGRGGGPERRRAAGGGWRGAGLRGSTPPRTALTCRFSLVLWLEERSVRRRHRPASLTPGNPSPCMSRPSRDTQAKRRTSAAGRAPLLPRRSLLFRSSESEGGREAGSVKRQNREPFRPSLLVAPRWGCLLVTSWIYVFV